MADSTRRRGSNRSAVDVTLRALRDQLGDAHEALIQLVVSLADAVDANPRNASLWREYRAAIADLGAIARQGADDGFARLVDRLRSPVGDAAD